MKLSISWLNDFVDTSGVSVAELAEKLVSAGFEVDGITDQRRQRRGVYTARILSVERHPNAEKLNVCAAVSRSGQKFTVVTGAKNIKAGDVVPLALDGAVLPDGKVITNALFRGVLSDGMFCGGAELALTEADYRGASADGVLIFAPETPEGLDVNDVLGFDDVILDVAVMPNRPDCNSVIGLAGEVSALLRRPLKQRRYEYETDGGNISDYLSVEVKDGVLCPRYMAAYIRDVKIAESPFYIKKRLRSAGIKSINNIVDITNYILIEVGQPMHAFDSSLLEGSKIVVRRAAENEEIISLDGKKNVLKDNMLIIADAEKPVAVAGIMGGLSSGVNAGTKSIAFESARFKRDSVRATSRELNLKSDSQARYEKGVDFLSQERAIERALSLISELGAGIIVGGVIDSFQKKLEKTVLTATTKKINGILGIEVPDGIISEILNSLGIETDISADGKLTARIPPCREDITNANDLSEEVIRLYGYDKIRPTLLSGARQTRGGKNTAVKTNEKLKNILLGGGFNEIISFSFINGKAFDMLKLPPGDYRRTAIKILNPLSEDMSVMRTTLIHSILSTAAYNINKGVGALRIFESAVVYLPNSLPLRKLPEEKLRLAFALSGEGEDFYTAKGVSETVFDVFGGEVKYAVGKEPYFHPGRRADIYSVADGGLIGGFGEIHPEVLRNYGLNKDKRVYVGELHSDYIIAHAASFRKFRAAPKYPVVERDLALIVDDAIDADTVVGVIKKYAGSNSDSDSGGLLEKINIFDVFKGAQIPEGKKSLALSLVFRSCDRTLNDAEINDTIKRILEGIKTDLNGELR
ncbi:MAG: phenylalanine--tRNA ligase subunit beta [Clostridiales bacterium]|jgi:phenylalanyl-tRNA synthetase beta chain|nr:phenylalanine--tRNA ligase subunit beta [Clostridiales bacterium]